MRTHTTPETDKSSLDFQTIVQSEDELRLAFQRLSYHVENTPLAVIEFDKDLNIKRWAGRAEEIFGWTAAEALSKNVYDPDFRIIFEEDRDAVNRINEELIEGSVNRNISLNRNYNKHGELRYSEWYNSVLRDSQGQVITILSLVHDITERRQAEITLNRSYDEIRRLSNHLENIREEERSHIAREIHDELGQQLTALKMDVIALSRRLNESPTSVQTKFSEIVGLLDMTMGAVRRISSELRPSLLYNLGLSAAIEWQLKEFEKRSGVKTVFIEPAEDCELPDSTKNALFRIFQESLTNAARHADPHKIIVSLGYGNGQIILTIEDDGRGFEMDKIGAKHTLGMVGMKERAQMMGGDFEIRTAVGSGTAVTVVAPCEVK